MGTEIVAYCAQPLIDDDGNYVDATQRTVLEEKARESLRGKADKARHVADIPPGLPRRRSQSIDCGVSIHRRKRTRSRKKENRSLRKYKANKSKRKHRAHVNVSDDEIYAMEIELRNKENAVKKLRKQNNLLRKQNEQFLSQYGSHFVSTSNSSIGDEKIRNSLASSPNGDNVSQISYSISNASTYGGACTAPEPIRIDLNAPQQDLDVSPYSPLTPLTNTQAAIILSYANNDSVQ